MTVRHTGLTALAPLLREKGGLAAPGNGHNPQFDLLAANEESKMRLARETLAMKASRIEILRISEHDVSTLGSASAWARRRVVAEPMQRSPYIAIESPWDEYEASLNKKFRKDLRRRVRRLEEEGEFAIEVRDGTEGFDTLLSEGFAVEALSWKGEQGTAIEKDPATESFYRDIARWAAERGWLRLWFLRVDGRPIAFCMDLDDGNAYYGLKVAHDPQWSKVSPGMILQDETVKYAFEKKLSSFEFLGDDEAYKLKWTKTCRERWAWRGYSRGPRGTAGWFDRKAVRPAVRNLKR